MNWYYAVGGQQKGPVSEAELEALFKAGVIDATALVWREGMANWEPYGQVKTTPMGSSLASEGSKACSQCGQTFTQDHLLTINGVWVCADCKPLLLQRIREGVTPSVTTGRRPLPVNAKALIEELRTNHEDINFDSCINRSKTAIRNNLPTTFVVILLAFLIQSIVGAIPKIGIILSIFVFLFVAGPIKAGLYLFFIKTHRNQAGIVDDLFSGFHKNYIRYCLCNLIIPVLCLTWMIPGVVLLILSLNSSSVSIFAIVLICLGAIAAIFLAFAFSLVYPLMVDLDLPITDSLRVSWVACLLHWKKIFMLNIIAFCVGLVGLLACCIGVYITMPACIISINVSLYEEIFNSKPLVQYV